MTSVYNRKRTAVTQLPSIQSAIWSGITTAVEARHCKVDPKTGTVYDATATDEAIARGTASIAGR